MNPKRRGLRRSVCFLVEPPLGGLLSRPTDNKKARAICALASNPDTQSAGGVPTGLHFITSKSSALRL